MLDMATAIQFHCIYDLKVKWKGELAVSQSCQQYPTAVALMGYNKIPCLSHSRVVDKNYAGHILDLLVSDLTICIFCR